MLTRIQTLLHALFLPSEDGERGDVPGWVLITLMTAGLVVAIWTVAAPALQTAFEAAINKVVNY